MQIDKDWDKLAAELIKEKKELVSFSRTKPQYIVSEPDCIASQLELAQRYADFADKLLRDKIEKYTVPGDIKDEYKQAWYIAKTNVLEELLNDLKTLKPLKSEI